jgi:hypothetical protein
MLDSALIALLLLIMGLVMHKLTDNHIWLVFFGGLALFTFAVMET